MMEMTPTHRPDELNRDDDRPLDSETCSYDIGDRVLCPVCETPLEHGGVSPEGDVEWFHVVAAEETPCVRTPVRWGVTQSTR